MGEWADEIDFHVRVGLDSHACVDFISKRYDSGAGWLAGRVSLWKTANPAFKL